MTANIAQLVRQWDDRLIATSDGARFDHLYERIVFSADHLFWQYLPTLSAEHLDFDQRLAEWIGALDGQDALQRTLLDLAGRITFFAREDFDKLHQVALSGPITRWIVDLLKLPFLTPGFAAAVDEAIYRYTWYCGLSDSMAIADFHHVNRLGGIGYRPDVRSLATFSNACTVATFMQTYSDAQGPRPLKRLVVLEDFVGSGTQLLDAEQMIVELCQLGVPVLLVPLVVCPAGDVLARSLASRAGPEFQYAPVLALDEREFVGPAPAVGESTLHTAVRDLVLRTYPLVTGDGSAAPRPYSEFGFKNTGALVVMFSNTPANTLPVVQHGSNSWTPLFPRYARVR